MEYRNDIQGLRALAVIAIFIFHLNPAWLSGGYIGVDIFFVISGFLMAAILLNKVESDNFSFLKFYLARLKRIVPAYYFMLLVTTVAAVFIFLGSDIYSYKRELMHAVIFNSNYCYAKMASYFGTQLRQNPLVHTWTIAIEMKFYFLLPILLFLTKRKYLLRVLFILTITLLSYSIYEIQIENHKTAAYYSFLIRVPEFLLGVLACYVSFSKIMTIPGFIKPAMGYVGLIILILCLVLFDDTIDFPGAFALLPCLGTAFILLSNSGPVASVLSQNPFTYIGTLSYSIYLWHLPLIALAKYYAADVDLSNIQLLLIVVFTLLLSVVSYTFIENYFRKANTKVFARVIISITVFLALFVVYAPRLNQRFTNIPKEYSGPVFGIKSHNAPYVETFGDTTVKKPSILLIGNSHALSLKPYLDYIGKREHFSFRTITTNSYTAIKGIDKSEIPANGRYGDYSDAQKLVPITEKEIKRSRVIILVSSSYDMTPSFIPAIKKLILNLREDQHLVLVGTFPTLNKNPLQANRGVINNRSVNQDYKLRYRNKNKNIMQLVRQYNNVHYFDLSKSEAFKDAPFYSDTIIYYDEKHLNAFGATVLACKNQKEFAKLLDSIK